MKQEIIKKSLSNKVPESEWVQLKIMSKMINDNEEVIYEATDNMNHKYKIVYDTETFLLLKVIKAECKWLAWSMYKELIGTFRLLAQKPKAVFVDDKQINSEDFRYIYILDEQNVVDALAVMLRYLLELETERDDSNSNSYVREAVKVFILAIFVYFAYWDEYEVRV